MFSPWGTTFLMGILKPCFVLKKKNCTPEFTDLVPDWAESLNGDQRNSPVYVKMTELPETHNSTNRVSQSWWLMATLDDKETKTLADLLVKVGFGGKISSQEDLGALVKPKQKDWFYFGTNEDDKDGGTETPTTVVPKLAWFSGTTPMHR